MSTPQETSEGGHGDVLPPDLERRLDPICIQFERDWRAAGSTGRRPRIEDYLGAWHEPARTALLRELVPLDIDYRRLAGEKPETEEYLNRFPSLNRAFIA